MPILLTWWRVLGLSMSWGKVSQGQKVGWIGAELALESSHVVEASLPDTFVKELLADAVAMRSRNVTTLDALRKLAGKASWATGIRPSLRSFLAPF